MCIILWHTIIKMEKVMKTKDKKIALVTGSNRGIGKEIVKQLADMGHDVYLTARDEMKTIMIFEELKNKYPNILFQQLDVTNARSVEKCRKSVEKECGRLDILINNAGIMDKEGSALETDMKTIEEVIKTNTIGAMRMCQAFVPLMKKHNYGRIVNMSSKLGRLSTMETGNPGYRVSKAGLNAITRIIAEEVKDNNILVNAMCPGWTKTEMGGNKAPRSVKKAAETAIWLATMRDGGGSGNFYHDKKKIAW